MKKLLSILLAGTMVFGLASAAMADPLTGNADAPSSQNVDISVEIGESFEWSVPAEIKMTDTGTGMSSDDYTIEISKAVLAPDHSILLKFTPSDCYTISSTGRVMPSEALMKCGDAALFYHLTLDGYTYTAGQQNKNRGNLNQSTPWYGLHQPTLSEGAASVAVSAAVANEQYFNNNFLNKASFADAIKEMFYETNHVAGEYSTTITFEAKVI